VNGASSAASPLRLRLCLAASGGGHLRQLIDLQPFWAEHDVQFVTEPTPLADDLARRHPVHLVPHFAFGQLRGRPARGIRNGWRNQRAARRAIRMIRPQLIISTGAGSVFFAVVAAKLAGARFILIESFARFETPSLFGRLTQRFADAVIVQSARLGALWPGAEVFDPLVLLGESEREKQDLGLVTVGTVMPFDRLVDGVGALSADGGRPARILAQVGQGGAAPAGIDAREQIPFEEMLAILDDANVVFCHGGTGSLITALRAGCRIIAMPRQQALGEHYDDHQREIVSAFAARGLIEVAEGPEELQAALTRAIRGKPRRATTDPAPLIERLRELARAWFAAGSAA
jgi:UDP-N-acetylglucosamine transferase subunit ALG13